MNKYYSINEFSKILGVSAQTLRNWDNNGKLKPHHTSSNGYRYYSHEQLNELMSVKNVNNKNKLDEIYLNTVFTISDLYYSSVGDDTKIKIDKIKKILIEGGDEK